MSRAFRSGATRLTPSLVTALLLAAGSSAMAQDANAVAPEPDLPRQGQVLDPYAASPTGNPAPGTRRADGTTVGAERAPASTMGAGQARTGDWWMPGGGRTAIGLNLGRSNFHAPCEPGFSCDRRDNYVALSARNMVNDTFGGEVGLIYLGRMTRGGDHTEASGLNLSLVAKTPTFQGPAAGLGAFAKLGTIWSHSRTRAASGSTLATGTENGFGLSTGAGLSWDFNPRMSAVLEWDRYWVHFAGSGRDPINATSVGLQWKY